MSMQLVLNDNDRKLLAFCKNAEKTIGAIAEYLEVRPSSISPRVKKLQEEGYVLVNKGGQGKKTLVRTKQSIKVDFHLEKILAELLKVGGNLSTQEFDLLVNKTLDYSSLDKLEKSEYYDKITAKWLALKEGYVEQRIQITDKGKKLAKK